MLWKIVLLLLSLSFFHSIYAQNEELTFSATGDVPYGSSEIPILMQQMADHNLYSPSEFLVHVGDIKSGSSACEESIYSEVADILKTASVPVYIVPGDNEYNDCSDPVQAWEWWTQYFMNFEDDFCGTPPTEHQAAQPENHAFVIKGVLMIGINLVGGRIQSQNEWNTRMQNDADWVDYQFQTKGSQVRAAVVYCQAGPNNSNRDLFFNQFRQSAVTFGKPILLLHGDGHSWKYDQPFPEQNIYRIQVNMGGLEDPVQLTVNLDPVNPFAYLRNPWSNNPQPYNVMPCVEAGSDTTIYLPDVANLHARSRDDGVPLNPGSITRTWSKVSGSGTASFADLHADTTTVSFSAPGIYTLRMTADDGVLQNYDDLVVTAISQGPLLTIDNVTLTEGNSGTSNATFTVNLLNSNSSTVTVDFATADSNATAGEDYAAASGTLTFSGSTTSRTIDVTINGDTQIEPDETFFVNLSNAANATILDSQGRGIIENDDFPPPPVISSFTPQEGPVGTEVTITGNYLLATTAVRFNGTTATNLVIDNDNTIRATVPPGASSGKIRVTNGNDSTLSATDFVVKTTLAVTISGNGSVNLDPAGGVYDEGTVVTLTANPDPGWNFVGWSGDLGGAVNPADVTMDSDKDITASFAEQGVGPVVHEETQSGGSSGSSNVSTGAPLTGVAGNLYLAAVSTRNVIPVSSVSGLGLTWTLVDAQCAGRSQTGIELWMAQGIPTGSGIVTATLSSAPTNAVIAVSRYSGVATSNPVGNIVSGNTNGVNGSCSGGSDGDAFSFDITASLSGAAVYAAVAPRNKTLTPDNPYVVRDATYQGSGGEMIGVAIQDRNVEPAATVPVGGAFSSTTDWAVIAVEIKPGGGTPNLVVNAKTFLQGPYQSGSMNTALRDDDNLPLTQPYSISPWNYNGSEAVDAMPAGVVDWVLVALRSTANGADFARRAAFIKSDGSVVDTGGGGVEFAGISPGDYFVVIYHRNHLGIMSSSALSLTESSAQYDFSTASTQAYGGNPMAEVETGVFGMISGDGNSDGVVNDADRLLWRSENGTLWSYSKGTDFNLDGGIDVSDLNYAWRVNNSSASGVPGSVLYSGISSPSVAPPGKPAVKGGVKNGANSTSPRSNMGKTNSVENNRKQ